MKNIFLAFVISAIGAVINRSYAQPATNNASIQNAAPRLSDVEGTNENSGASPSINARALKSFHKSFYSVKNETWYNAAGGGYISRFISDSVNTVVAYNAKGFWQYTLRYYNEKKLPRAVRSMVKSTYYDYDILGAIEVLIEDQDAYLVYLRDEDNSKTILVTDDDMKELESFKRN